jgi:hypothetical protein
LNKPVRNNKCKVSSLVEQLLALVWILIRMTSDPCFALLFFFYRFLLQKMIKQLKYMKLVSYRVITLAGATSWDVSAKKLFQPKGLDIVLAETSLDVAPASVISLLLT